MFLADKTVQHKYRGTHMQHEFGVSMDEFNQSKEEALVTSSVQICGFLFELKAGGFLSNKC